MPADVDGWEVVALIAALDPGIARRLLRAHPAAGWCRACRVAAPCPTRTIGEAAERASRSAHH